MKRIYKIILSLIIIIVLQYSAFSGYKLFLNSMLETKKKTNFSILNYVSSSVKLLNNSDYKIEDIQNTFFENTIYSDFEIVLLDESQMVVIKTDYFENLNFNKLIIEKKRDVFSQKLFDAFFYRNSQKKYLISKNNIKINNENMYLLIISQVETNYSYFINYGLWIMLLILFVSLIIIYSLFSKKKGITAYLNNFEGAITLPILEKHFFIPYLIIDKSNKISKVNNEMIELLQKDKETILSKNIAEIIPKLQDFQKLEKNGNFSDFDFTINEMLLSTKIKVMPFIDKSYQRNSHIIFMLNNSQDKNDKLRLIYDMNKAIALLSDPKLIITEILKITRKITNFSSSTILIPEKNYLIPYFTNNKEILGMVDSIKIKYGQGLSGTVAKTMKGMIINNAQNSDLATQVDDTEQSYEHLIAIPLTYKNELTGVMLFTRTYEIEFTHEDLSFLEMVGSSTSSILHNSILLQQLSTTEKKYRELISHATIGIFILEENKTIFFNNTFIKLLEIKPEFQIEKPFI
ncbi:MAG: GAF domain-containing protein, partial [Candidatus Cloacimonadota bacterium]|nr:GAF domain-containing protein [Candidatus Cloacimonadota bacterium]